MANYRMRVFEIPASMLMPGPYAVSFQFQLPEGIPSTIYYKDTQHRARPKAKIKYFVKTTVHAVNPLFNMKVKSVFIVREPPVIFKMNENQHETSKIKTWCCID